MQVLVRYTVYYSTTVFFMKCTVIYSYSRQNDRISLYERICLFLLGLGQLPPSSQEVEQQFPWHCTPLLPNASNV